jgi:hypothetical protein
MLYHSFSIATYCIYNKSWALPFLDVLATLAPNHWFYWMIWKIVRYSMAPKIYLDVMNLGIHRVKFFDLFCFWLPIYLWIYINDLFNSYNDINHHLFSTGGGPYSCGFLENKAKDYDPRRLRNFTRNSKFDQLDLYCKW